MKSTPQTRKILLTGATGFIGPAVARALVSSGHTVRAAGRRAPHHTIPIAGWTHVPDQTASTNWSTAFDDIDVVVHLAGRAHAPRRSADARTKIWSTNVEGTERLARQAASAGVRRFVFLSSLKVHGDESGEQPHIATDPMRPTDIYGESKRDAELRLLDVAAASPMELVVIRPPLIVGPGGKANVARLMQIVRSGAPLPFGSVNNRRSILGLSNLADLVVLGVSHPRAPEQPLLAADAIAPSTPQLIQWMAMALNRTARLFRCPPRLLELTAAPFGLGPVVRRLTRSQEVDASATWTSVGWQPRLTTLQSLIDMCESQVHA